MDPQAVSVGAILAGHAVRPNERWLVASRELADTGHRGRRGTGTVRVFLTQPVGVAAAHSTEVVLYDVVEHSETLAHSRTQ